MESLSLQFSGRYSPKHQTASVSLTIIKTVLSYLNNYLLVVKKHRGFSTVWLLPLYSERFHSISHLVWWLKAQAF